MQRGNITRKGSIWFLRYYEATLVDGKTVNKPKSKKLCDYDRIKYPDEKSVQPLADLILAPINARTAPVESDQTAAAFLEHVYLPYAQKTKKPSTYKSYVELFNTVKPHLGNQTLRGMRTPDIDRVLQAVADEKLHAHTTFRNLKSLLSGGFRFAKRNGNISENPVRDSVVPRGLPAQPSHAYTLPQIQAIIKAIPEPAKTACLIAGLTGLRLGEIKGLKWSDVIGDDLHISRSVWQGHVTDAKTLRSRAPIPMLPLVKKALAAHRKRTTGTEYIFHGETGKPLRLENVVRRIIKPALKEKGLAWYGWHAFRRGVGTNLHTLGVDDKTISDLLRHGNVDVTRTFYMKTVDRTSRKAMSKLEKAFKQAKRSRS